jgi:hypothetical protein
MEREQERRAKRRRHTGEDFTPESLVNQMLDQLPKSCWHEGKTFCDPACGNGNLLVPALRRKLDAGHDPLKAIQTVFGTDIMKGNIRECRLRLLKEVSERTKLTEDMIKAVFSNIICTPLPNEDEWPVTGYENGSLDYDFKFGTTDSMGTVRKWHENIDEMLKDVENDEDDQE